MDDRIHLVTMPKWGLAMHEGVVVAWHVAEGDEVRQGQPLCDVETAKIANEFESPVSGLLARRVAAEGAVAQVGEVIAVVTDGAVDPAAIDARLGAAAGGAEGAEGGPALALVPIGSGVVAVLQTGDPGAAEGVLLLHGFGGDHANFDALQAALPPDLRVAAIDLPGHGATTAPVGDGSAEALARAVLAACAALGLQRVHLVAHSFGAAVALAAVRKEPGLVASLALIAPTAFGARADPAYIEGFLAAERKRDMKPVMERLFAEPGLLGRTMVNEAVALLRDPDRRAALAVIGRRLFDDPASADAPEGLPLLVVWGDRDGVVPMPADAPSRLGDCLSVVPGAGHMPHVEAPSRVAGLVAGHVRGV
jgi:pyruvate dehydrogenase E2 component (dihydrolipoamide acetyltransferase)